MINQLGKNTVGSRLGGDNMKVFFDLGWFFKQEKKAYITGVFLLLLVALLQLVPPKIIGIVADHINDGTVTKGMLTQWVLILIGSGLLTYVLRYYWRIMIFGSSVKLSKILRNRLYHHFTNMSPAFYQKSRIGDLMAHATNDLSAIQQTAGVWGIDARRFAVDRRVCDDGDGVYD